MPVGAALAVRAARIAFARDGSVSTRSPGSHAMTIRERIDFYEKLMRLDKPIGILLLLWPTLWGVWVSSIRSPNHIIVVIFAFVAVLMRSAGCIVNDVADRDFDRHVERTKDRPLAARLISPQEALLVAGVLILL